MQKRALILRTRVPGERDERGCGGGIGSDSAGDLESVQAWQPDVAEHDIRLERPSRGDTLLAVMRDLTER